LTYKLLAGEQALGQWRELFGGYFVRFHQRLDVGGSDIADMHVDQYQTTLLFAQALIESCISGAAGTTEEHL
jgi:hypothetical protein